MIALILLNLYVITKQPIPGLHVTHEFKLFVNVFIELIGRTRVDGYGNEITCTGPNTVTKLSRSSIFGTKREVSEEENGVEKRAVADCGGGKVP